jgi:four helix bundle protein
MQSDIHHFSDLTVWQKSYLLSLDIYKITDSFPVKETYGIVSQMRRATASIMANIAEGFSRYHFKDKIRFYYQARGSLSEVESFLYLSKGLDMIDQKCFEMSKEQCENIQRLLNGLIRATDSQI